MMNGTFATRSSSCCVSGVRARRITREEVVTLRNISVKKKNWSVKLKMAIQSGWRGLVEVVSRPVKGQDRTNSMCKYYGHVIQGPWQGYLPKCADCGCEINSPDQLRKASPRS